MANFFLDLKKNAERFPASIAMASTAGHLSYDYLLENVDAIAANAIATGLKPGQTVLVDCSSNEARLLLILGMMRAGMTVGLTQTPDFYARQNVTIDAVITDDAKLRSECRLIRLAPHWFKMPSGKKTLPGFGRDYGLIFGSSGSTGRTKLIQFDRANIEYRIKSKSDEIYFQGLPRFYSTTGNTSSATFADFMITLQKGGVIIQSPNRTPDSILNTISLFRPSYATMAPMMLVRILRHLRDDPREIEKLGHLRLTGAYCSVRVRDDAVKKIAHDVITSYGATEIARVASGQLADIRDTEGSVGTIMGEMDVETVDDGGKPLPTGNEGEIRIRPPKSAVATYIGEAGVQSPLQDGWFYPGDIGRVDDNGRLIITGRKSLVINLGGNKVSPELAEAVIMEMNAIEDAGVLGVKDANGFDVVCALVVGPSKLKIDDINTHLRKAKTSFALSKLQHVDAIPRTDTGKVDRTALRDLAS